MIPDVFRMPIPEVLSLEQFNINQSALTVAINCHTYSCLHHSLAFSCITAQNSSLLSRNLDLVSELPADVVETADAEVETEVGMAFLSPPGN